MIIWPDQPMKLKGELLHSAYLDYPKQYQIKNSFRDNTKSNNMYIYVYVKLLLSKLTDLSYVCKYASCELRYLLLRQID